MWPLPGARLFLVEGRCGYAEQRGYRWRCRLAADHYGKHVLVVVPG